MSVNNRKQRNYIYGLTFLKWTPEQRLSSLEQISIETSLAAHKFGTKPDEERFNKLCESISDLETMIEVAEESFPKLRETADKIMKSKLVTLKKQTVLKNAAKKHEEKAVEKKKEALNLAKVIEGQKKNSKKLNYFGKLFRL